MNDLLDVIPSLIAEYLPPEDAINFSCTSKKQRKQMPLTTTPTRKILTKMSKTDCDDARHYAFKIPLPSQVTTHSLGISFDWMDQGWGNRKGEVAIVAEEDGTSPCQIQSTVRPSPCHMQSTVSTVWNSDFDVFDRPIYEFDTGKRVVYTSPIAPHIRQKLTITFQPKQHETYHVFYTVGGGGGHSLHL